MSRRKKCVKWQRRERVSWSKMTEIKWDKRQLPLMQLLFNSGGLEEGMHARVYVCICTCVHVYVSVRYEVSGDWANSCQTPHQLLLKTSKIFPNIWIHQININSQCSSVCLKIVFTHSQSIFSVTFWGKSVSFPTKAINPSAAHIYSFLSFIHNLLIVPMFKFVTFEHMF